MERPKSVIFFVTIPLAEELIVRNIPEDKQMFPIVGIDSAVH